jgi:hypothetical protein
VKKLGDFIQIAGPGIWMIVMMLVIFVWWIPYLKKIEPTKKECDERGIDQAFDNWKDRCSLSIMGMLLFGVALFLIIIIVGDAL